MISTDIRNRGDSGVVTSKIMNSRMLKRSLLAIVAISVSLADADNTNYCNDQFKCNGTENYACKHKVVSEVTVKENGETVTIHSKATITENQRGYILASANDFRNEVAHGTKGFPKGGANIRQLTWDFKLEKFAKIMATNALNGVKGASMGTSLSFWIKRACLSTEGVKDPAVIYYRFDKESGYSIEEAMKAWTSVTPGTVTITRFSVHRHGILGSAKYSWTALAWAEATKIGCAFYNLDYKQMGFKVDVDSVLCVIGSGANSKGKPVLKLGKACSSCAEGTSCNENSRWKMLCATADDATKPEPVPDVGVSPSVQTFLYFSTLLIILSPIKK